VAIAKIEHGLLRLLVFAVLSVMGECLLQSTPFVTGQVPAAALTVSSNSSVRFDDQLLGGFVEAHERTLRIVLNASRSLMITAS
jgi:hypothetical protein